MKKSLFLMSSACCLSTAVLFSSPIRSNLGSDGIDDGEVVTYTATDYIQDGLVAMWDAIENFDYGVHVDSGKWRDLVGGIESRYIGYFDENSLLKESLVGVASEWVFSDDPKFNVLASRQWTVEIVMVDGNYANDTYTHSLQWIVRDTDNNLRTVFQSLVRRAISWTNQDQRYFGNILSNTYLGLWPQNADGAWVREIGHTYDGSSMTAYKSGFPVHVEHGSIPYTTSEVKMQYPLRFHNTGDIFHYHALRIYNRALSPQEIRYNNLIDKERFGL